MAKTVKSLNGSAKKPPLHIKEFIVCNFMRLEGEHRYQPEDILIFEAPNGFGKSSMLTAIQTALTGVPPKGVRILNDKAEQGFVKITFSNDISVVYEYSRTKKPKLTLIHPEVGPIEDAKAYLEKINNALTINPLKFLNADKKDRVAFMLEAMPMMLTKEQIDILAATPKINIDMANLPSDTNALEWLEKEYDRIYSERRTKGQFVTAKEGTIKNYTSLLLSDKNITEVRATVQALENERTEIETEKNSKLKIISDTHTTKIQASNDAQAKDLEELGAEYKRREKELNDWYNSELNAKRQFHLGQRSEMADTKTEEEKRIESEHAPRLEEITIELAKYSVEIENIAKAEKQQEIIDETKAELAVLSAEYDLMSEALKVIENTQLELANNLPVKGMKVIKGEAYHNGQPWDALSHAEQMDIAAEIALLKLKDAGIMSMDNLEGFDVDRMEAFKKSMKKNGIQVIGSRVPQNPKIKELTAVTK